MRCRIRQAGFSLDDLRQAMKRGHITGVLSTDALKSVMSAIYAQAAAAGEYPPAAHDSGARGAMRGSVSVRGGGRRRSKQDHAMDVLG